MSFRRRGERLIERKEEEGVRASNPSPASDPSLPSPPPPSANPARAAVVVGDLASSPSATTLPVPPSSSSSPLSSSRGTPPPPARDALPTRRRPWTTNTTTTTAPPNQPPPQIRPPLSSPSPPPPAKGTPHHHQHHPSLRPSPHSPSHITITSTGTPSLDNLLAGHAGLPLGCALLLQENGVTDYAGALAKVFASQGVVGGQRVVVLGFGEEWGRGLPGLAFAATAGGEGRRRKGKALREKGGGGGGGGGGGAAAAARDGGRDDGSDQAAEGEGPGVLQRRQDDGGGGESTTKPNHPRMKIAWRYESVAPLAHPPSEQRDYTGPPDSMPSSSSSSSRHLDTISAQDRTAGSEGSTFSHTFDLRKRLVHPPHAQEVLYIPIDAGSFADQTRNPFENVLKKLRTAMRLAPITTTAVHSAREPDQQSPLPVPIRILAPSLLSPATYPPQSSRPEFLLPFLHALKALLTTSSVGGGGATAMITLPLDLYPRSAGVVRWIEILCDGVVELCPWPWGDVDGGTMDFGGGGGGGGRRGEEEREGEDKDGDGDGEGESEERESAQGLLKVHKLPVFHEQYAGSSGVMEGGGDWTFTLSRRRMVVRPWSLPPVGAGDELDGGGGEKEKKMNKKADIEF